MAVPLKDLFHDRGIKFKVTLCMKMLYIVAGCGFDSHRHTQILYKENRRMPFRAQKTQKRQKENKHFDFCKKKLLIGKDIWWIQ